MVFNIYSTEFIDYVKCVDKTFVVENQSMKQEIEGLKQKLLASQQECADKDRQLSYLKLLINQGKMEKVNAEKERNNLVSIILLILIIMYIFPWRFPFDKKLITFCPFSEAKIETSHKFALG